MKTINLNLVKSSLTRDDMRSIKGGFIAVRDLKGTKDTYVRGGETVCLCTWQYNLNDGNGWQNGSGACPTGDLEYSCLD